MRFRTLDENWDFNFGAGLQNYASESMAVAYNLKSQILSWYRDCFFDMETGIDWKNILGSKVSKSEADAAIRKIVAANNEVDEILFFESSLTNRVYTCTIRIKTIYGQTIEVKI